MKLFRSALCFASFALLASAAPVYKVTLTEPAVIAGSVVKAGDYRSEAGKNMLDDIHVGGTTTTIVFKR